MSGEKLVTISMLLNAFLQCSLYYRSYSNYKPIMWKLNLNTEEYSQTCVKDHLQTKTTYTKPAERPPILSIIRSFSVIFNLLTTCKKDHLLLFPWVVFIDRFECISNSYVNTLFTNQNNVQNVLPSYSNKTNNNDTTKRPVISG